MRADPRPLVSIVTPTRNQGSFIPDTLGSVCRQTYRPIEHIVIDGASTDSTLEVLRSWEDRYDLRWLSEPDRGMYDAVNKGVRQARGDVLGYLNSDDLYLPWAVEAAVEAFERHPEADVVFGDALRVDDSTGEVGLNLHPPFSRRWTARFGTIVQPAVFWRRSAWERFGEFDANLRYIADLDYWLRIGATGNVVHVPEVLAVVRWHDLSLTVSERPRMRDEEVTMRARHHRDRRSVRPFTKLAARLVHATGQRVAWLRFAAALRSRSRSWGVFRTAMHPRLDVRQFAIAFLPLVGRVQRAPWIAVSWPPGFDVTLAADRVRADDR